MYLPLGCPLAFQRDKHGHPVALLSLHNVAQVSRVHLNPECFGAENQPPPGTSLLDLISTDGSHLPLPSVEPHGTQLEEALFFVLESLDKIRDDMVQQVPRFVAYSEVDLDIISGSGHGQQDSGSPVDKRVSRLINSCCKDRTRDTVVAARLFIL